MTYDNIILFSAKIDIQSKVLKIDTNNFFPGSTFK